MDVWGPIGEGRKASISSRSTVNGTTKPKASPMTSSTLTNGSDHTSVASPTNPTVLAELRARACGRWLLAKETKDKK